MKESVGGISIFQIVIIFVLLFAAIMSLTINHTKAFAVKDEIINILERETTVSINNGKLSNETVSKIVEELDNGGYRITGTCPNDFIGYNRNGSVVSRNASFCIKVNDVNKYYIKNLEKICENNKCNLTSSGNPKMVYYDIKLFYQLDIPIIRNIFNFTVNGSTKVMFG